MSLFLNELKPLRVYNGPYYYPIDMKDRSKNSIVYLLTPNTESTVALLNSNNNNLNKNTFNSYFLEKNIQFIINKTVSENSNILINDESVPMDTLLNESLDYRTTYRDAKINENGIFFSKGCDEYTTLYTGEMNEEFRLFFPDYVDEVLQEETVKTRFGSYNVSNIFRELLFNNRLKSQKEIINIYDNIKKEVPFIKYTYTDPKMYKGRNIYYDWSYYTKIFFEKNNKKLENREKFYLLLPVISDIINKMFGVRGNTRQCVKGTDKIGGKLWLVH